MVDVPNTALKADMTRADSAAKPDTAIKSDPVLKATADAQAADIKVQEAQAKAGDAKKSPEQLEVDKAAAEADQAHRKAMDTALAALGPKEPMTVTDAKVMAPVPENMGAGDHMAQKFGNDPENPHIAKGEHADPELATVRLSRKMPDHPDMVYTTVHPEMVGDYLRAGWNQD